MVNTKSDERSGIMFIAAHQDDAEGSAGGLFAKLRKYNFRGCVACFTDGTVGHYKVEYLKHPDKLGKMRDQEASNAANVYGFEYKRLVDEDGNPFKDARLEVNWKSRGAVWKAIRDFRPDLIITLPVNDLSDPYGMHNDHSNVGEIVKRTAYLIPAPLAFPEFYPKNFIENISEDYEFDYVEPPIIVTTHDPYSGKIEPDIVISLTEDELDMKVRSWYAHISQWKEWLPWVGRYEASHDIDDLKRSFIGRSDRLSASLPIDPKPGVAYESFTITNWALRIPKIEEIKKYFPDDVLDYKYAEKKIAKLSGLQ